MIRKLFLVAVLCLGSMAYAGTTVPFEARIDTELRFLDLCGPTCVNADMSGEGQALQGGRVTMSGPAQINFVTGAQAGTPTITAADGSTLTLSFEGFFTPSGPDVTFAGTWTATNGTGRFQNVSGGGTYDGFGNGPSGYLRFKGTLNNPGQR